MRSWTALVVFACGCDAVFGLHDRSSVIDASTIDADTSGCVGIASPADLANDFDHDGVDNAHDPCPLFDPNGSDSDGDGVPDACDPFDGPRDHQRCTMVFLDGNLNTTLWTQLTGANLPFDLTPGMFAGDPDGGDTAGAIATATFEGTSVTTYEIPIVVDDVDNSDMTLDVWLRASTTTASHFGCELRLTASSGMHEVSALDLTGHGPGSQGSSYVIDPGAELLITAILTASADAASWECRVSLPDHDTLDASNTVSGTPIAGNLGLAVQGTHAHVLAIDVLDE
nr:hypothetical protein [Kofleriaceae bacterium]